MALTLDGRSTAQSSLFAPIGTRAFTPRVAQARPVARAQGPATGAARLAWIGLTARVLAATVGNYVVTALLTAMLARIWPIATAQASMAATLLAFAVFPVLVLTSFAVRSPWRLWAWLMGASALMGAGLWLSFAAGVHP